MELHEMNLHDILDLPNGIHVLRVPDFWVYTFPNGASERIPFSYEFSGKKERMVSKEWVSKMISDYYNIPITFYTTKNGEKVITKAKRMLVSILYVYLKMNHEDIAEYMQRKSHTSSVIAITNLDRQMRDDEVLRGEYDELRGKYLQYKTINLIEEK